MKSKFFNRFFVTSEMYTMFYGLKTFGSKEQMWKCVFKFFVLFVSK